MTLCFSIRKYVYVEASGNFILPSELEPGQLSKFELQASPYMFYHG